jgi:hypothetical protein
MTGTAGAGPDGGGAGSDGGTDASTDASEAGAMTPEEIHDALINAPVAAGTTAIMITRVAPKAYATCK